MRSDSIVGCRERVGVRGEVACVDVQRVFVVVVDVGEVGYVEGGGGGYYNVCKGWSACVLYASWLKRTVCRCGLYG